VGKSTLVNAIVGAHVAIVSERPQTTRRAIRGVATDLSADWQLVMTDLPGVQRPRDALTERMQRRVEREIADSDAVLFVVNAEQGVGPGDRFITQALLQSSVDTPVVCAVNKVDRLNNAETAAVLAQVGEIEGVDEIFPVSARKGHGLEPLIAKLIELLPDSPFLFPPEQRSDLPSDVLLAELIREQVLRRTRDELPHAVEVQVSEVAYREDGVVEVHAHVWAETESQKGILIGAGGRKIKEIGTAARAELERELGGRVFLDLQVRVRKSWRKDESLLDRLGIE
jgi:GTP-binding protein Era